MITEIDILQHGHRADLCSGVCKKPARLLGIVSDHHELVVELRENGFNPLAELPVGPAWLFPVLLVQPIGMLKPNVYAGEEVELHRSTEIAFVCKHRAIVVFPLCIIKIMNVMDVSYGHVIRMDDTIYSADAMELISVVDHILRGARAFRWSYRWILLYPSYSDLSSHSGTL